MIVETRQALATALEPCGWDVHMYEPSNATGVPCVVVGRPTFEVAGHLYTLTETVWVIGRRMGDPDALAELDAVADQAMALISNVCQVTALLPTVRTIAELTYPAYRIDCVTGEGRC